MSHLERRVDFNTFVGNLITMTEYLDLFTEFEEETGKSVVDDYEDFFRYLAVMVGKEFDEKNYWRAFSRAAAMRLAYASEFSETFFMNVDRDSKEYKAFLRILNETIGSRLPDGEIIGYKTAIAVKPHGKLTPCIVKLRIPKDAKRSKAFGKKCRCDEAFVEDIYCKDPLNKRAKIHKYDIAQSSHDENFKYNRGEWVSVDDFDDCPWVECSEGIHFFENEEDAYGYLL